MPADSASVLPGVRHRLSPTATTVAPWPASPAQAAERPDRSVVASWASTPAETSDCPVRPETTGRLLPVAVSPVPSLLTL